MKKRVFVKKLGLLEMLHFTATTMSKGTSVTPQAKGNNCHGQALSKEAMCWGSPGAGKLHAGKYEELTSLRQRGGGGWQSGQPPPYPLSEGSHC